MKFTLINILLILSIVLTFLASVINTINYWKHSSNTETISQANKLMLQTYELRSIVKDAEISQRGYLLTRKIDYLKPYIDFEKRIDNVMANTLLLVKTNTIFQHDLDRLIKLINRKRIELKETITVNDSLGNTSALKIINSEHGNRLMDSIRKEANHILYKEKKMIEGLNTEYDQLVKFSNFIRYGIQFFVISMTIVSIFLFAKRQKQNTSLISQLNTAKENLELKVEHRTKQLHEINQELTAQNEEIQSQAEQISVQNEQLVKLNEEKNRFIGIASHDMKSPINRIKGLINIIKMKPDVTIQMKFHKSSSPLLIIKPFFVKKQGDCSLQFSRRVIHCKDF